MRKSTGLLAVAMFSAVVMVLFANSPSAEAKGNCQAKLLQNSYNCSFVDNDFPPFTECWDFFTGGLSQYFDLDNSVEDYGCACDPAGKFNSAVFDNSSSSFECEDGERFYVLTGKISGKKLSVQGIGASGEQYVGTCTISSSPCP